MAAGVIRQTANELMARLASIPYDWDSTEALSKNDPTKLFQVIAMWNNDAQWWAEGKKDGRVGPQAFIQFLPSPVIPLLSRNTDMRDLNIRIHILDMQDDAGDGTLDQNLSVYDYRDATKKYVDGFKITHGGRLIPGEEEQDYEHRQIYHYMLDFKVALVDSTASPYVGGDPDTLPTDAPTPDGWIPDVDVEIVTEINEE